MLTVISDHPLQDFVEENCKEAVTVDRILSSWYKWPTSKESLKESEGNVTQVPLITKYNPVLVIFFPFLSFSPPHTPIPYIMLLLWISKIIDWPSALTEEKLDLDVQTVGPLSVKLNVEIL